MGKVTLGENSLVDSSQKLPLFVSLPESWFHLKKSSVVKNEIVFSSSPILRWNKNLF